METNKLVLLILVLGGINFAYRFLPAVLLKKVKLVSGIEEWLSYVPIATIGAILFPLIFLNEKKMFFLSLDNTYLLAAIPTSLVAFFTKSLAWTLLVGVLSVVLLRYGFLR